MDSITNFLNSLLLAPGSAGGSLTFLQAVGAMAVAYLGGVLSSLTPCVYPMIPITVSVVGGISVHSAKGATTTRKNWGEVIARSLVYVLGMTVVYSFLGVVAGLTGKVLGTLTNTSGWYLGIGVVMSFSALVMLDVIPFDPLVWIDAAKRRFGAKPHGHSAIEHREMSYLGAFTLGATSGLIAAPCTTPVLTTILAYIARTQSVGLGLVLMVFFSLGLGTLLLLIAVFTSAIQILPRSGMWMKKVKLVSGLILLAFSEYLIYRAGASGGP